MMRVAVSLSKPHKRISGCWNLIYKPVEYENHSCLSSESTRGATLITCHPYSSTILRNSASPRLKPSLFFGSSIEIQTNPQSLKSSRRRLVCPRLTGISVLFLSFIFSMNVDLNHG